MPLGRGHQGVAAPDEPEAWPVLRRVGVLDRELELLLLELLDHPGADLGVGPGAGGPGLVHHRRRGAIELREEGEPAVAHGPDLVVHGVARGEVAGLGQRVELLVLGGALVAPLVGVDVVEAGGVLQARRAGPVEREGQRRPGRHRGQLLLADVVVEAAAVLADAAAEHQAGDGGAVGVVAVVPLVHAGADDDRALAAGLLGGGGPLPGEADHLGRGDAGEALLPGRGVGRVGVLVAGRVVAGQAARDPVLGEEQVVDRGHLHPAAQRLHLADRHAAAGHLAGGVVVEGHLGHAVVPLQQGGAGVDVDAVDAVLHLQVPLPLLVLPAEAEGAAGHAGRVGGPVPDQELEVAVLGVPGAGQLAGRQHPAGAQAVGVLPPARPGRARRCSGARSRGSTGSAARGGTRGG